MSALTNPSPAPPSAAPVQQPPVRITPVTEKPPKRFLPRGKWLVVLLVAGALALGWRSLRERMAKPVTPAVIARTAKVVVGPFERTLRVSGVTSARLYANVTAPRLRGFESRNQMELLSLIKNGAWVKPGETLAQIDPGQLLDHIDDIKATIVQAEGDIKKRQAEQAVDAENLNQTLRVAQANVEKARLDVRAMEVRTDVERELLRLALEEAEARYKQVQLEVPEKRIVHAAELKILEFTKERHVRHVNRHLNDLKAYTITAPMEGMVVIQSTFRGGEMQQIQQGDQLNSGQQLIKIVNPKSMQVEANVNQTESAELRINQVATIGLDAFPGLTFRGKVYSIGALAVGGWRQNYFIRNVPVKLTIESADPRLIPDLSAWADVVVERQEQATLVPLGAIQKENGKTLVYVKQGDQFVKREVKLGSRNHLYAVALAGLQGGEEVRLFP
ncbi:MAG: HlyD family efflux transporter periplasmic adaptor subunit [Bryobacteraceae bacterium]|nr:HlyD family efflux transporter periplasmic adaptor subunit [Bryobacteraceae bacterium]MDW8377781.1 HlyD family efflux transporter periplasmic adaptor subunit [Bryobacterales bacterium]